MAKDIAIGLVESPVGIELFNFKGKSEQYASGFYKLIFLWLKCLLTEQGSNPANLEYGTAFPSLLGANVNSPDINDLFLFSIDSATSQIRDIQSNQRLDDQEKLSGVVVRSFNRVSADTIEVVVEISNVAGDTLAITLPSNLTET